MKKSVSNSLNLLLDLLLLNSSFMLAAGMAQSIETLIDRAYMFILLGLLNLLWYLTSNAAGFYDTAKTGFFSSSLVKILRGVLTQAVTAILFIFVLKEDLFTRNFIVLYSVFLTLLVSLRSVVMQRVIENMREKGRMTRRLLIIGAEDIAKDLREMIDANPSIGFSFAGFLTPRQGSEPYAHLANTIIDERIEEAIVALPQEEYPHLKQIMSACEKYAVRTHIVPDYFQFLSGKFQIGMLGNFPVITVRAEPLEQFHWRVAKRLFDIFFSLFVIVCIISWLFPLIIITQMFTSRGPVFFVQERIGRGNKPFKCYKFRTMTPDPVKDKYTPAHEREMRVTPFGRFMRRTNIDELPQMFNVLFGTMSVVGPRPHATAYDENYGEFVDENKLRHLVKPGITGLAQVHGLRGDVSGEENKKLIRQRIEKDIWYIENWTFWLDLQIIFATVWKMLAGRIKGR